MSGRTLKRVALDFEWPMDKVWKGYINPWYEHCGKCPDCELGYAPDAQFLHDSWYRHIAREMFGSFGGSNILAVWDRAELKRAGWPDEVADNIERAKNFGFRTLTHWSDKLEAADIEALVKGGRLWDFTHTWDPVNRWKPKDPPYMPTPDEVNAWSGHGMGHDSINAGICIRARCERLGVPVTCATCGGDGHKWKSEEAKKKAEEWKEEEPPEGPGWQLWETVSEGSPITPVFKTAGDLAAYCSVHGSMGPDSKLSKEQVLRILRGGTEEVEAGSTMIGVAGEGIRLAAEINMGEASPKDWTPDGK